MSNNLNPNQYKHVCHHGWPYPKHPDFILTACGIVLVAIREQWSLNIHKVSCKRCIKSFKTGLRKSQ